LKSGERQRNKRQTYLDIGKAGGILAQSIDRSSQKAFYQSGIRVLLPLIVVDIKLTKLEVVSCP